MDGMVLQALVAPTLAALVLWRGWRRLADARIEQWQRRFDVEVTDEHVEFVRSRLERGRRVRAASVAIGVVVGGMPSYMNLIDSSRSVTFANPLVANAWLFGAAIGALIAEIAVVQGPIARRAALDLRHVYDYVDRRFVRAVYVTPLVTGAAAVVATGSGWWRWWYAWIGVAGAALAAVAVFVGLRSIVHRPALSPMGVLREVDDALRADGAFRVVGAAVALAGVSLGAAVPHGLRGTGALVFLPVAFVSYFALGWWWSLARDVRWSVRRARRVAA